MPIIDSRALLAAVRDQSQRDDRAASTVTTRRQTQVYIVASPRPRSGKTFLARLLTDYLTLDGGSVRAFDLGTGVETLRDCVPGLAIAADIDHVQGQIALFDRLILGDTIAKVIDLGSGTYARFFDIVEQIGLTAEARRRAIEPIVLFAADGHASSVDAYADLEYRFGDMLVVPVFNEAIAPPRALRGRFPGRRAASVPLQIPMLTAGLKAQADQPSRSFAAFHAEPSQDMPATYAYELRAWTRRAFLEFRELELRMLLEQLRASLPGVRL